MECVHPRIGGLPACLYLPLQCMGSSGQPSGLGALVASFRCLSLLFIFGIFCDFSAAVSPFRIFLTQRFDLDTSPWNSIHFSHHYYFYFTFFWSPGASLGLDPASSFILCLLQLQFCLLAPYLPPTKISRVSLSRKKGEKKKKTKNESKEKKIREEPSLIYRPPPITVILFSFLSSSCPCSLTVLPHPHWAPHPLLPPSFADWLLAPWCLWSCELQGDSAKELLRPSRRQT